MTIYRDGEPAARASDEVRQAKRRLVGVVRAATTCNEAWDTLPGDACTRRCNRCPKNVHDIDAMTVAQVEDLAAAVEAQGDGSTDWVRFSRRGDGRLIAGDCPIGVARRKDRKRNTRIAGVVAGVLFLLFVQATVGSNNDSSDGERVRPTRPILTPPTLTYE
jgi:hypothetical protein